MADSLVAEASAKPTVTMTSQPWPTRLSRFGPKSFSLLDSTGISSTPSSSAAWVAPSKPSWLNDLSSKPPASETMHGWKSLAAASLPLSLVSSSGASPHAARVAAASSATRPLETTFLDFFTNASKFVHPGMGSAFRGNDACPCATRHADRYFWYQVET